ncbi:MAG TPA: LemA family protein, partial [Ilumatobacter sp.]|nr:LemA family protein [Ilumatobacter sp.]
MWPLIIVLVLVVALVAYLISAYNGLIRRRNQIENAWSQIDVQLKRRLDLIPNLVETVKGYAAHERETLDAVIQARNAAVAAPDTPEAQS